MGEGTGIQPLTRMDLDPQFKQQGFTDTTGDFRKIPFKARTYDVVVFDPTHITDSGHTAGDGAPGDYAARYNADDPELKGQNNIGFLFGPFVKEAHRVLPNGGGGLAENCELGR